MFEKSNICSPRYTYTFLLKLSFKKLTFKKVFWGYEYTYTLDFEKLLKNLLLKNFCKRSGTRTLEFWKSFWKVGGNRVHNRTNVRFFEQPFVKRTNFHLYEQNFTHEQVFGKSNKNSNTNSSLQTRTKFYNKLECEKANKLFNENTLT